MVDHSTFREKVDAIWKIAPDATFSLYRPTYDLTPTMRVSLLKTQVKVNCLLTLIPTSFPNLGPCSD